MQKVIEVVDTAVFREKLERAEAILPFAMELLGNKKNVAKFLGVHPNTVTNYIGNNTFKKDVHYSLDGIKVVFIPLAIIDFKINPPAWRHRKEEYKPCTEAKELLG